MITKKVRKSYFVDSEMVKKAMIILEVSSEAEAIRISVQTMVEIAEYWKFMDKTAGSIKEGSFK